jgi:hypothetical protein
MAIPRLINHLDFPLPKIHGLMHVIIQPLNNRTNHQTKGSVIAHTIYSIAISL